jgi:hypothetical protein
MKLTLRALSFAISVVYSMSIESMAEVVKGYPDLLVCKLPDRTIVLYLQRVPKSGPAIYMSPNSQFVTLNDDGKVYRSGKEMVGCEKKQFSD